MLGLRYVYVLALSIWFGGLILIGAIAAPVSDQVLRRFFVTSYATGGLLIVTLLGMALLGPRPSGFFARVGVAGAMYAMTIFAGLRLHHLPLSVMTCILIGGLALLFWEARDGTRAA